MKRLFLGILTLGALSLATGCSTAYHGELVKHVTGQGDNSLPSNSSYTLSQSTGGTGNTATSQSERRIQTVKAVIKMDSTADNTIRSQSFIDPSHGWIVVGHEILSTVNGGKTWSMASSVNKSVTDIGFISSTKGWALSGDSLQLTEDGGHTWHTETLPHVSGIKLQQAQFVDETNGWVMGTGQGKFMPDPKHPGSGTIPSVIAFWSTANGGKTWTRITVPSSVANHEFEGSCYFSFVSKKEGLLFMGSQPGAGQQGKYLYRTEDGGQHWEEVTSVNFQSSGPKNGLPGGGYISGLYFLNGSTGWMSQARGPMYVTTDGGRTWRPLLSHEGLHNLSDVHFLNSKYGYTLYRDSLLVTSDGGITWRQVYPGVWPTLFLQSTFFNAHDGVSAGTTLDPRAILRTTDGGFTWTQISSVPGSGRIIAQSFSTPENGWVITDEFDVAANNAIKRTIYQTTDGGLSWKAVSSTTEPKNLYTYLSFVNAETGFIASGWGHLFETQNGGKTLTVVTNKDSDASNIQFISPDAGWKMMNHHLYSTSDGGQTWHEIPISNPVINFDLVNESDAWVMARREFASGSTANSSQSTGGDSPLLLSTTDGGQSWTVHDLGKIKVAGIVFADAKHGWFVDEYNHYFHTDDGGHTWTEVNLLSR